MKYTPERVFELYDQFKSGRRASNGRNIFLLGNSRVQLNVLIEALKKDSFLPDFETQISRGLVKVFQAEPDLVFTEMKMSDGPAGNFLQQFRSSYPNTPVILLIEEKEKAKLKEVLDHGITSFFIKPINPDKVVKKVKEILADKIAEFEANK